MLAVCNIYYKKEMPRQGHTIHVGTKYAAGSLRPRIPHFHTGRNCQDYKMAVKIHTHLEPGKGRCFCQNTEGTRAQGFPKANIRLRLLGCGQRVCQGDPEVTAWVIIRIRKAARRVSHSHGQPLQVLQNVYLQMYSYQLPRKVATIITSTVQMRKPAQRS